MSSIPALSQADSAWFELISTRLATVPDLEFQLEIDNLSIRLTGEVTESWKVSLDGGLLEDAGSRALLDNRRFAEAALLLHDPSGNVPRTVDRVRIKVVGHDPHTTRARLLDAAAWMPVRVARRRLAGVADPVIEAAAPPRPLARWQRALLPLARIRNLVARVWRERLEEVWSIGIIEGDAATLVQGGTPAPVRWLPERPNGYLADPFGVEADGRAWIFAEAYDHADRKGFLVAGEVETLAAGGSATTVLECPHHLSYPQVFRHDGQWWMLPEATASGRVTLYRTDSLPDGWSEHGAILPDFAGADPTLFHDRDHSRWWLFATSHAEQDETSLHLFHASGPEGPWHPHAGNPVKTDIGSARPAGPLFHVDGALIRPAQDCSERYGGAVVFNRVLALTPEVFVEETIARLDPDPDGPYPHGLHSLTPFGDGLLIDGKREFHSWRRLAFGVRQLLPGTNRS
ncbi:MAG: hypothetical protein KDF64_08405 [Geminicoccaceae bacterium]|nr:hypothetical protein [Geminicoccaceae bacterium]